MRAARAFLFIVSVIALAPAHGGLHETPTTPDVQAKLFDIQEAVLRGKRDVALANLLETLPSLEADAETKKRGMDFFRLLLDSREPMRLPRASEIPELVVAFTHDYMRETVTRSTAIYAPSPLKENWIGMSLSHVAPRATSPLELSAGRPGLWLGNGIASDGVYELRHSKSVKSGDDSSATRFVVMGVTNPSPPPPVQLRWLDEKRLELTLSKEMPSTDALKGLSHTIDLTLVNRSNVKPLWNQFGEPGQKLVVDVAKSDADLLVLYVSYRTAYTLAPLTVLREVRRVLPLNTIQ